MFFTILAWVDDLSQPGKAQPPESEISLIRAAKANPAAFEPLYQLYVGPVYRYLRLHTGSEEDASDLTQQVFLQGLAALPRYQEQGIPFGAWLFRIARNLAINATQRRRPTVAWELLPPASEPMTNQGDPEAEALRQEKLTRLHHLLAKLDRHKRELLALHFGADLSIKEIAVTLRKSEAATKKELSRTISALRKEYGEQEQ